MASEKSSVKCEAHHICECNAKRLKELQDKHGLKQEADRLRRDVKELKWHKEELQKAVCEFRDRLYKAEEILGIT